ncbi:MAG: right-handed parallel beta-helix repeat-containing protein [Chloroflexi bacterium]|nr:right-handed parallel beta-helix repeat-containing protein [Chloroflexota bacterium]MBU1749930.1 right-handed parallel beta-helix repeat-containing protein [Chloroflexota bacterium]
MHRARLSAILVALVVLAGILILIGSRGSTPPAVQALGTTRYVAPGECGGMTPCYSTIQAAIDAAQDGDVIKIAASTYTTLNTHGGLGQIAYITKSLTLQGGYTTANWTTPDPDANVTTLDANQGGRAIYIAGDITVTIDGLHLTDGDATGLGGSPWADGGGGICVLTATVTLSRNTIDGNVACEANWAEGTGGGVYLRQSAALVVSNTISGNTAARATGTWSTSDGSGGGLYAEGGTPILQANHILNNMAATGGDLFDMGDGGGLCFENSQPTVNANWIRENQAPGVGGGVSLRGCLDFTLINNLIADNQSTEGYGGAGVAAGHISGVGSRGRLIHTTIARNLGPEGTSGVRIDGGTVVTLTNTILAGHDTGIGVSFGSTATLTATLWANTTDWGDVGAIYTGTLNYWGNPAFLNPDAGDYHISSASAARDRGVDAGVSTDLDGTLRDDPPDLGAYECFCQSKTEPLANRKEDHWGLGVKKLPVENRTTC